MSLNGIFARLSDDSSHLELVHRESGRVLERLPVLPATEEHRAFILATWVRSYAGTARKYISKKVYVEGEPAIAEKLWSDCSVVTSPDDSYTVHAWICVPGEGQLAHVYVIPDLRRKGIARALISGLCGPNVQYGRPWPFGHVPGNWTFNPYILAK